MTKIKHKKNNHFDEKGNVQMVDIGEKSITTRKAIATGIINVSNDVIDSIESNINKKGDVLSVASTAAVQAVKNTSTLIPLTHNIQVTGVNVKFDIEKSKQTISCTTEVKCDGKTGVEIEALIGVQIGLLTIYDMCKYLDRSMVIGEIKLLFKEGGKSGKYKL
ncbi:MAG: cyclic pyranopterin monophosphate synthase MoaC [Gammaproteobacteria bacterium]|nr:cyclic pyranopterin monophosphate synthase MoaC [Gammaproteobacteria bacterium]|tara:strand:+ start:505 stop:993 length:489 start_codon:yes stop_codon:yes gene_type:complete